MVSLAPRLDLIQAGQNLAINGNFDFFQRGAGPLSISNAAVGRLADRFNFRPSATNGTGSMTRSTTVPTFAQSGFQSTYSLQITAPASGGASSANTTTSIDTRLEGFDYALIHGKPTRVAFWVHSSVTGTYYAAFCNSDHSREYLVPYTISAANTWERKIIDVPQMDTAGTWLFDNGIGLALHWILQVGSSRQSGTVGSWFSKTGDGAPVAAAGQADFWGTASATFRIAQVMIVQGSFDADADLPFKRAGRTISDELMMCQRYFEKSYNITVTPGSSASDGYVYKVYMSGLSSAARLYIVSQEYKVQKRTSAGTLQVALWTDTGSGGYGLLTNAKADLANGATTPASFIGTSDSNFAFRADDGVANTNPVVRYHWAVDVEL